MMNNDRFFQISLFAMIPRKAAIVGFRDEVAWAARVVGDAIHFGSRQWIMLSYTNVNLDLISCLVCTVYIYIYTCIWWYINTFILFTFIIMVHMVSVSTLNVVISKCRGRWFRAAGSVDPSGLIGSENKSWNDLPLGIWKWWFNGISWWFHGHFMEISWDYNRMYDGIPGNL